MQDSWMLPETGGFFVTDMSSHRSCKTRFEMLLLAHLKNKKKQRDGETEGLRWKWTETWFSHIGGIITEQYICYFFSEVPLTKAPITSLHVSGLYCLLSAVSPVPSFSFTSFIYMADLIVVYVWFAKQYQNDSCWSPSFFKWQNWAHLWFQQWLSVSGSSMN